MTLQFDRVCISVNCSVSFSENIILYQILGAASVFSHLIQEQGLALSTTGYNACYKSREKTWKENAVRVALESAYLEPLC